MSENKKKTAVTKKVSYKTKECRICERETALEDLPEDSVEPSGYAVLLGEGELTQKKGGQGNWDQELKFELDKSYTRPPNVKGFIVCEDCAEKFHNYPKKAKSYRGEIPSEVATKPTAPSVSNQENSHLGLLILAVVVFLIILLLIW